MTAADLVGRTGDLRPPSPSVIKLLSLLTRPDCDAEAVVRIVEQDVVLSAKVLSLCNSAWFGKASPVSSLSQALLRLGFQQIHRLVMAVSFGSMMNSPLDAYAIDDRELWRHSLVTALISRAVFTSSPRMIGDPSIVFTAGLVHDIGKLVLNGAIDDAMREDVLSLIVTGGISRIAAEREIIGCDHAEVGAHLLSLWSLPDPIVEAVANHHAPIFSPEPRLSAVVHLADIIAHEAGSAPGWESFAIPLVSQVPEALQITAEAMERLVITAFDIIHSDPELAPAHECTP